MRCFLDMDGVIADFIRGACALFGKDYDSIYGRGGVTYDCAMHFDMSAREFWSPLGREFWAGLPKTPEADAIVEIVERAFGQNVCILTAPCLTDGCMEGKLDWLRQHYPQFSRRFIMGPAKGFCGGPGSVLVDDHTGNTTEFEESGGHAVLVARPWNHLWQREVSVVDDLERDVEHALEVLAQQRRESS